MCFCVVILLTRYLNALHSVLTPLALQYKQRWVQVPVQPRSYKHWSHNEPKPDWDKFLTAEASSAGGPGLIYDSCACRWAELTICACVVDKIPNASRSADQNYANACEEKLWNSVFSIQLKSSLSKYTAEISLFSELFLGFSFVSLQVEVAIAYDWVWVTHDHADI